MYVLQTAPSRASANSLITALRFWLPQDIPEWEELD